jgi:hypothetical protein
MDYISQREAEAIFQLSVISSFPLLTDNCSLFTEKVGLRKKPPRVMISCDYSELPTDYVNIEYTPKLAKIKELLKSEAASGVNWAYMSESHEYSVTIR